MRILHYVMGPSTTSYPPLYSPQALQVRKDPEFVALSQALDLKDVVVQKISKTSRGILLNQHLSSLKRSRYPISTLFPFLVGGLLLKTEQKEDGYAYCLGRTGELRDGGMV